MDSPPDTNDIVIQCRCGTTWFVDYEPTPEACEGDIWRLGIDGDWSPWLDSDGKSQGDDDG